MNAYKSDSARHGFELKLCVKRSSFKPDGDKYDIEWQAVANLSFSYSAKRLNITKKSNRGHNNYPFSKNRLPLSQLFYDL